MDTYVYPKRIPTLAAEPYKTLRMKKILFAAFVLLGYNFSCNKNGDVQQRTNAEAILGNWKLTAMTYTPAYDYNLDGTPENDAYAVMAACEKDNVVSFLSGGAWKNDEGASKCSPSDPQTINGTWSLATDQETLTADGEVTKILQLDDSVLKLESKLIDGGTTYTIIMTLQRQ